MKLKVGDNLFIIGNAVVSYETVVARINFEERRITELAKYSRSTTKQLIRLSGLMNYSLVSSKKGGNYWQLPIGVKCEVKDTVGPAATGRILEKVADGSDLVNAALLVCSGLSGRDRAVLVPQLRKAGCSEQEIATFIEAGPALKSLGIV